LKVIIPSIIAICLLIGAQSAMALKAPYWSDTPVNISSDYKQIHLIITHINHNLAGAPKTKVSLGLYIDRIRNDVDLASHIVDISKHVRPTEKNTTLDVGYFIIPTSLIESAGPNLTMGIHVLGEDGTVVSQLNATVYMDLDDYYQTI
jgi:hypothetical protein